MYERKIPIDADCGVTVFQTVVGAKWKPYLISCLTRGIRRPAEFQKAIAGADRRVLAKQLRELEQMGIIRQKVYPAIPQRVEYFLTDLGESVVPVIRAMDDWGNAHRRIVE